MREGEGKELFLGPPVEVLKLVLKLAESAHRRGIPRGEALTQALRWANLSQRYGITYTMPTGGELSRWVAYRRNVVARGLCTYCRKRRPEPGFATCRHCLEKMAERDRKRREVRARV